MDQLRNKILHALKSDGSEMLELSELAPSHSYLDLNPQASRHELTVQEWRKAAVLIPLVERKDEMFLVLTQRTEHLPTHAGQIAFPGGRVHDGDETPVDTALRETEEEIGVQRSLVEVAGVLDCYATGSGFIIQPVVGFLHPGCRYERNPAEVTEVFEVPFRFLMDPANHKRDSLDWGLGRREFYALTYKGYYIWGATAAIIVNLYDRLYG